jgi:hypothetical protein
MAETMNVDRFKKSFDGGSRPNRFMVSGEIPATESTSTAIIDSVVVRAASMPAVNIGIMRVPFRGRIVKIPGDRTYDEWTITLYDTFKDKEAAGISNLRKYFHAWNAEFNLHESNIPGSNFSDGKSLDYDKLFIDMKVVQLTLDGNDARTVTLSNTWPTVVGEIVLNYDSSDTIAEYSVTFAYDHLKLEDAEGSISKGNASQPTSPFEWK